ncbi:MULTISPECIES: hypothetical protein [unclassified Pseudovibrio]|uniref:hypothetical protein n=1 Tax=unclassified Pseudovibrio TaxID=2627060 RepID=UPI0007AE4973|nr:MULTISPECIES: hypothetical protein [unclassified Pseudovibrio]KZK92557.1 hypothetical protein PsW74_05484 [Pseudovibrio sp. W74]KZL10399.1 hypothetical protein PsAD14_01306 [Pseudovibrio sp. Ad14]
MANESKKNFYERTHPEYAKKVTVWKLLRTIYDGGRQWFILHIFKFHKEGNREYADRVGRAYRFNHTREVVESLRVIAQRVQDVFPELIHNDGKCRSVNYHGLTVPLIEAVKELSVQIATLKEGVENGASN